MGRRQSTVAWLWSWAWPILVGLLIGAVVTVAMRAVFTPKLEYTPAAVATASQREQLMDDPFVQVTRTPLVGGEVRSYFVPADGRLLIVFDDLTAPREGAGLRLTVECGGETLELGTLAARFYGDTSSASDRNSLIYSAAADCTQIVLTATTIEGTQGASVLIPISPPRPPEVTQESA